jgi:hypothetical protein
VEHACIASPGEDEGYPDDAFLEEHAYLDEVYMDVVYR